MEPIRNWKKKKKKKKKENKVLGERELSLFSCADLIPARVQSSAGILESDMRNSQINTYAWVPLKLSLHMNTKSGNFSRGYATRENTVFDVNSVKQNRILH